MRTTLLVTSAFLSGLFFGCAPGTAGDGTSAAAQSETVGSRTPMPVPAPAPSPGSSAGDPRVPPVAACATNADCARDSYCQSEACGGSGVCTVRPTVCLGPLGPVCGCDGTTYLSDCRAAQAGVNVGRVASCDSSVVACSTSADCGPGSYCARAEGTCGSTGRDGTCTPIVDPSTCGDAVHLVCGCDGVTYTTPCDAAAHGINVSTDGACAVLPAACRDNRGCPSDQYCAFRLGACGGDGRCETAPSACPLGLRDERVCGCDGVTYESACYASVSGANVAANGACSSAL